MTERATNLLGGHKLHARASQIISLRGNEHGDLVRPAQQPPLPRGLQPIGDDRGAGPRLPGAGHRVLIERGFATR